MARRAITSIENTFVGGLLTEATGLNFPEKACTDTYNCVFESTGRVRRRKGFDWEPDAVTHTLDRASDEYCAEYVWQAVAGEANLTFVVTQFAERLRFYALQDDGDLSVGRKSFTVNLESFKTSGAPNTDEAACQFATGRGDLFVTHPYCDPFYIRYNASSNTISTTRVSIRVRDLKGIEDDGSYDNRPSTLTDAHNYDLYNQGWHQNVRNADDTNNPAIDYFEEKTGDYPSNADIWYLFKNETDELDSALFYTVALGNMRAPRGHHKFDPFNTDRSAQIGDSVTEETSSYFRPTTCAFFAGRAWFSGVTYQGYNNKIYFSQVIERDSQVGYCYQLNDPTSEVNSDLLASDGGVISINDAGTIIRMVVAGPSLLVFASNGIWSISGSEGIGFRANDYTVTKVSSTGSVSPFSMVDVQGALMWWNIDGIYMVTTEGAPEVRSLTDNTIRAFFNDIPASSIFFCKGAFNSLTRIVQWVYKSTGGSEVRDQQQYDRVLNYDTVTGAFYPWTIEGTQWRVTGIVAVTQSLTTLQARPTTSPLLLWNVMSMRIGIVLLP
jgi:uncharacterized protein with PQ loop repeat